MEYVSDLDYIILGSDWFTDYDEIDYVITSKGEPEAGTAISEKHCRIFVAEIIHNTEPHKNTNLNNQTKTTIHNLN